MADLATQCASLVLYRNMCQYIVGTEEYVKTIRMMINVRDILSRDSKTETITSGSFGEGLEMLGSDLDIMHILKHHEVCEKTHISFKTGTSYFLMETDDTPPGYTQLRQLYTGISDIVAFHEKRGNDIYCSSALLKQKLLKTCVTLSCIHGPCVSDKKGLLDIAMCLHSKSWITPAMPWITRPNNGWPTTDVKQSIVQHGALFVPIGIKGSKHEELEWRISFSVGEKFLIFSFTHTQLLCYALLKILLKDVIEMDLECSELLCSYFLKTILFWISEEFSPQIWRPENLISNFMKCFRRLIYCVQNSICPHYFIPENNLFENKIKGHAQKILLNRLVILNNYDWQCILFSPKFSLFYEKLLYGLKDSHSLHVYEIEKLLRSLLNALDRSHVLRKNDYFTLENGIRVTHFASSFANSKIKYLYWYHMSKYCHRSVQLCPFNDTCTCKSGNKLNNRRYKICKSKLLLNLRHDAVSGWLFFASFLYYTKQYSSAIDILKYSLLKCTEDKVQPLSRFSLIHYDLFNLNIFRKMNVTQLLKLQLVENVHFWKKSIFIPDELLSLVGPIGCEIPPVVYAHFLSFLCHYHLNNTRQCRDSIQDLQLTIAENYFIAETFQKDICYNILGIAFEIIGDKVFAKKALLHSVGLKPDRRLSEYCHR